MKFCNKCGSELNSKSKFCGKCGAKLNFNSENNKISKTNFNSLENTLSSIETNNFKKQDINQNYFDVLSSTQDNNKDFNFDDINNTNSNYKYNYTNSHQPNIKKSNSKLILTSLIVVGLLGSALFSQKDYILYNYYNKVASNKSNINDRLNYYSKAIALKYDNEIINNIYDTLKNDVDFENNISNLSNLKEKDKQNLIHKICIYNANKAFDDENYKKTFSYLNIAKKYGYDVKDFPNYNELVSRSENQTNKFSSKDSSSNINIGSKSSEAIQKKINSYSDYILANSNSTYLSRNDLRSYTKETLALIRNEIYARHGYIFETEPFKTYFNSKSWYIPNSYFKGSDEQLNDYEIKNVQLIKNLENGD